MANFRDFKSFADNNKDQIHKAQRFLLEDEERIKDEEIKKNKMLHIRDSITHIKSRFIEEFNESKFDKKVRNDFSIFNMFLGKIEDEKIKLNAKEIVGDIYGKLHQLCEMTDINPKSVLNDIDTVADSNEKIQSSVMEYVNENIELEYYSLDKTQREKKYLTSIIYEFQEIDHRIKKEEDIIDVIATIQKKLVVNSIIKKIVFPFITESKFDDFIHDSQSDEIFDKERLLVLKDDIERDINKLSKIFAEFI
jgi:hypothetical protein